MAMSKHSAKRKYVQLAHTHPTIPACIHLVVHWCCSYCELLLPHAIRLESNYHYQEGNCLPRSSIYDHYLDFCTREQLQPVNAASFGKVHRT